MILLYFRTYKRYLPSKLAWDSLVWTQRIVWWIMLLEHKKLARMKTQRKRYKVSYDSGWGLKLYIFLFINFHFLIHFLCPNNICDQKPLILSKCSVWYPLFMQKKISLHLCLNVPFKFYEQHIYIYISFKYFYVHFH